MLYHSSWLLSFPFVSVVTNILDCSMAFFYPICELYCTLALKFTLYMQGCDYEIHRLCASSGPLQQEKAQHARDFAKQLLEAIQE